jgi:hypothetical protein
LNQNEWRHRVVDRIARGDAAAEKFQRLLDLITFNYSYNCFEAIRRAKVHFHHRDADLHRHPG